MRFNLKICCGLIEKDVFWIRIGQSGSGISISRTQMSFSERNGFVKSYKLPLGWRLEFVKSYLTGY